MAMICPKCGTQNPDHAFYCGVCAASLREELAAERPEKEEAVFQGVPQEQAALVKKQLGTSLKVLVLVSALMLLSQTAAILSGDRIVGGEQLLIVVIFLAIFIGSVYEMVRIGNEDKLEFFRHKSFVAKTLAEVNGFNVGLLMFVIVMVPILVLVTAITYGPDSLVGGLFLGGLLIIVFTALAFTSRITVEQLGICTGSPSATIRSFYPFNRTQKVVLSKHILMIKLGAEAPWLSRTQRLYVRENVSELNAILRRILPPGRLEVVGAVGEGTAAVPLQTCPQCGKEYEVTESACPICGTAIPSTGYFYTGAPLNLRPVYAGILLIIAGLFAWVTATVFFSMGRAIEDLTGQSFDLLPVCGYIEFLLGLGAMFGGLMAMRRTRYGLARAGAIAAIISIGGLISLALGIVALVLLSKSQDDFETM